MAASSATSAAIRHEIEWACTRIQTLQRQFWDLSEVDNPTFERLFSPYIARMGGIERVSVACILTSDYDMSIASNDKSAGPF